MEETRVQKIPYAAPADELADGDSLVIDPAEAEDVPGPTFLEINQIVFGGACDVAFAVDLDDDGTYEIEETVDSFSGSGISMGNEILVAQPAGQVLMVTNTSGGPADFSVTGQVLGGVQ